MTVWKLEGFNTDRRYDDVRYRAYTTSAKRAEAFKRVRKICFSDSGHGIVFHAVDVTGQRRLPVIRTLEDYVQEELSRPETERG